MKRLTTSSLLTIFACASLGTQAYAQIPLPLNGGFDVSKPGTGGAVGGVVVGNFLRGIGEAGVTIQNGTSVNWDDATSSAAGETIDILGWNLANGAGGDTLNNGPGGSLAWNSFAGWGDNSRIQSNVLGQISPGESYTISVVVGGPAGGPRSQGIAFNLLANGVALTPDAQTDVTAGSGDFETISRTFEAASLTGVLGQDMTIIVGVTDENTAGNRIIFDDVSLVIEGGGPVATLPLSITPNESNPGNYDFTAGARDGFVYDLVSGTDLSVDPATWPVWENQSNLTGIDSEITISNVPGGAASKRFFALVERAAP